MYKKVRSLIEISRPDLTLAGGLCVITGQIISMHGLPSPFVGLMGFLTGFFVSGSAIILNDYFDYEVDLINSPSRPIPSGEVSLSEALVLMVLFAAAGFLSAGLIDITPLIFALFIWLVSVLYNWKYKEAGLLGNMMVALSVAWFFIFGSATVGKLGNTMIWVWSAMAFLFDLGEEIASDAMDMEGDMKRSARTLPILHGKTYAIHVSTLLFMLFISMSFIIVLMNRNYLFIMIPLDLVVLYLSLKLLKSDNIEEGKKTIRMMYLAVTLFVGAFAVLSIL